jgi:hypothetical protein
MTTKKQMIDSLKAEFPTLQIGDDKAGYTQLSANEYDAVIADWANVRLAKEQLKAEAEAKEAARQEILDRLGLTADEAKLLLG